MGCNLKGVAALLFVATWAAIAILAEADADPSRHGIRFGIRKHYRPRPPPVRFHDRWHKHDRLPLRHQITRPHSHFFDRERSIPPTDTELVEPQNPQEVELPRVADTLSSPYISTQTFFYPTTFSASYGSSSSPYINFFHSHNFFEDALLPCGCINCGCTIHHDNPEPQPPAVVIRSPVRTETKTFQIHPIVVSSGLNSISPITVKQTTHEYTWHTTSTKTACQICQDTLVHKHEIPPVTNQQAVDNGKQEVPSAITIPIVSHEEGGPVNPPPGTTVQWHDTSVEKPPTNTKDPASIVAEVNEGGPVQPPPGTSVHWHDTSKDGMKQEQPSEISVNEGGPVQPSPGASVQWHDTSLEKVPVPVKAPSTTVVLDEGAGPVQPPPGTSIKWHDTSMGKVPVKAPTTNVVLDEGAGPVQPPPGTSIKWHDTSMTKGVEEGGPVNPPEGILVRWNDTSLETGDAMSRPFPVDKEVAHEQGGPIEPPPEKNIKWHDTSKDSNKKDNENTNKSSQPAAAIAAIEGGPEQPPPGSKIKWHHETDSDKMKEAAKQIEASSLNKTSTDDDEEDEDDDYINDVDLI